MSAITLKPGLTLTVPSGTDTSWSYRELSMRNLPSSNDISLFSRRLFSTGSTFRSAFSSPEPMIRSDQRHVLHQTLKDEYAAMDCCPYCRQVLPHDGPTLVDLAALLQVTCARAVSKAV